MEDMMNRMLVRFTGATAVAAAVLALSTPVLANGQRGGDEQLAPGQQSSGGGNRGGNAGRSGGGESMRSSGGARFSSGGSGRSFSSGSSGRNFSSGSLNNNGARFSGGVMRPGNGVGRAVEAPRFVE